MDKIHPCLWFDQNAQEAAEFYCSVFPNSRIKSTSYYGDNMPLPKGTVLTVMVELNGATIMLLNGGPVFQFSEALSLVIPCKDQAEMDGIYEKLSADPKAEICGWLKDKYGLSWQMTGLRFEEMMSSGDEERINRVMAEVMKMKRLDLDVIERAWDGE